MGMESQSLLKKLFDWEGVSFVTLLTIALGLLALPHQYRPARLFFVFAATALALKLALSVDAKAYPRLLVAALSGIFAGVAVNQVNDWVTSLEVEESSKVETRTVVVQQQPSISQIAEELRKKSPKAGPRVSAAQMEEIKELDRLILSRDESTLRLAFGFPSMMATNIQMTAAIVGHAKRAESKPVDLSSYISGREMMVDSELAEGHIRRFGGGFQYDPPDDKRVFLLVLPNEYSVGKKVLLKHENSSELPAAVVVAVKNFDDAVYKNADKLLHVLNAALKKRPRLLSAL
jgi:hypothetical protein